MVRKAVLFENAILHFHVDFRATDGDVSFPSLLSHSQGPPADNCVEMDKQTELHPSAPSTSHN